MRNAVAVVVLVGIVAALGASTAAADPRADAEILDRQAKERFSAQDYAGALSLFEDAYRIYASPGLLYNMGTTLKEMGRSAEAANVYQRYLDDPGASDVRAAELRTVLAVLDATLGRLAVRVTADRDAAGRAEIQIGDGPWQAMTSSPATLRVDPGTYLIRARSGDLTGEATGRAGAGVEIAVAIELQAPPRAGQGDAPGAGDTAERDPDGAAETDAATDAAAAALPGAVAPPPRSHRRRRIVAASLAGAGVLAIGGGVLLALRASGQYDDARAICGDGCAEPEFSRAKVYSDAAATNRIVSTGLFVAGGAAIAVGTYLWIRTPRDHATRVSVIATPDELGFALAGRF